MIEKLSGVVPNLVLQELPLVMAKYDINTPLRLAHFLAQCAHESGGFKIRYENLKYSAKRLQEVFPKYFQDAKTVARYVGKPDAIANRVYGNRVGNGNESSGDGYKYRGRGYIQLTGKANYIDFSKDTGIDAVHNPDVVAEQYPLLSAAWFWSKTALNKIADANDIKGVTKRVNGGFNGLAQRTAYFNRYYNLLA